MATSKSVASALKILSRAFAGVVDAERIELYRVALDDLSDEQLGHAVVFIVKTHTGEFIPPPAVIRRAITAAKAPAVDVDATIRRIEKLAVYSPHVGMIYPGTQRVIDELGERAGYAYAAAGGPRVFSEHETTRDIARREFQTAMTEAAHRIDAGMGAIGSAPLETRAISERSSALDSERAERLIAETALGLSIDRPLAPAGQQ